MFRPRNISRIEITKLGQTLQWPHTVLSIIVSWGYAPRMPQHLVLGPVSSIGSFLLLLSLRTTVMGCPKVATSWPFGSCLLSHAAAVKVKVVQLCPSLWLHGLCSPWNFLGQNTGVNSLSLLQGIFPIQGSVPGLLHYGRILHQLS